MTVHSVEEFTLYFTPTQGRDIVCGFLGIYPQELWMAEVWNGGDRWPESWKKPSGKSVGGGGR